MNLNASMRDNPLLLVWAVHFASPQDASPAQRLIHTLGHPDHIFPDVITGSGTSKVVHHRAGDYFQEIRLMPTNEDDASTFRLVFRRLPGSGRYWKDLMMAVLDAVRKVGGGASIALAYRGDDSRAPLNSP
jgi:hypothetical protein